MNSGKRLLVATVGGLALLGVVVGTSAAAGPEQQTPPPPAAGLQQGWGALGGAHGARFGYQAMSGTLGELLGLTPQEIHAEREAGKSLAQVAEDQGVGKDAVVDALTETRQEALAARVEAGTLTRAQADGALAQLKERIGSSLDRTAVGPNRQPDGSGLNLGWGRGTHGQQSGAQDGEGFGHAERVQRGGR